VETFGGSALKKWLWKCFTPHIGKSVLLKFSALKLLSRKYVSPMKFDEDEYILTHEVPISYSNLQNRERVLSRFTLRWAEMGTVYRYEKAGVLHWLASVRGLTQDDAHLIVRQNKLPQKLKKY
jgi:threonyl-tRNA synthetase